MIANEIMKAEISNNEPQIIGSGGQLECYEILPAPLAFSSLCMNLGSICKPLLGQVNRFGKLSTTSLKLVWAICVNMIKDAFNKLQQSLANMMYVRIGKHTEVGVSKAQEAFHRVIKRGKEGVSPYKLVPWLGLNHYFSERPGLLFRAETVGCMKSCFCFLINHASIYCNDVEDCENCVKAVTKQHTDNCELNNSVIRLELDSSHSSQLVEHIFAKYKSVLY